MVHNIDWDASIISDNFIDELNIEPKFMTRDTDDTSKIKKKYFRQPAIYQNKYI